MFIKNYSKLSSILNTSILDLSKHFVAENLITTEDQEEIFNTTRDKARSFLLKIELGVRGGFTTGFHIMLDTMLRYGSVSDKQLAEQIKNEIDEECKNGNCIYCTYVCITGKHTRGKVLCNSSN